MKDLSTQLIVATQAHEKYMALAATWQKGYDFVDVSKQNVQWRGQVSSWQLKNQMFNEVHLKIYIPMLTKMWDKKAFA